MLYAAVGAAAALGSVVRYLVDQLVQHQHDQSFPWGTLLINVSGSLLLGLVTGLALHHGLTSGAAAVYGVGFLGGYTTWSTYLWEALALAESGSLVQALLNLIGSLIIGLAAAAVGLALALG